MTFIFHFLTLLFLPFFLFATNEPLDSNFRWPNARKDAIGTAFEAKGALSPVWFTTSNGSITEVYYPQVDSIQSAFLKFYFLFKDGSMLSADQLHTETNYQTSNLIPLMIFSDSKRGFRAEQKVVTDPNSPRLLTRLRLFCGVSCPRIFVRWQPAIQAHPSQTQIHWLKNSVRAFSKTLPNPSLGAEAYLQSKTKFVATKVPAPNDTPVGDVNFWAEIKPDTQNTALLTISFSPPGTVFKTTKDAFAWSKTEADYARGWNNYSKRNQANNRWLSQDALALKSLSLLKMHEDKLNRGAFIAAFSIPGIPQLAHAHEDYAGYHLIWPRDLYQVATAFMAINDWTQVQQIFTYLLSKQLPNGAWAQNFWINGTPSWPSLQMDEVSAPILIAGTLVDNGVSLTEPQKNAIRKAALFISKMGPSTPQERWEEVGGYSPHVLASEIAALRIASRLLNDPSFLTVADQWEQSIETWTFIKNSARGRDYYCRISPTGTPKTDSESAQSTMDLGFLELVRLGVRTATDKRITSSLAAIETQTDIFKNGYYRRYNGDVYGWNGRGGFWPLLTGEKGEFELQAGRFDEAEKALQLFRSTQTPAGHLAEQIDDPQTMFIGPNSASPLAWSHAGYIRLASKIKSTPSSVKSN
ncbi:MAG: glucan 1,4-alpha-glucosidase [Pseudomonadota bacterium]|jgi:glucoamylase